MSPSELCVLASWREIFYFGVLRERLGVRSSVHSGVLACAQV